MRLLVDECTGPTVARWLQSRSFDVYSVYDQSPGLSDDAVLNKCVIEDRVLITNDKDFGDMVYREWRPHRGVILLRLHDPRADAMISALDRLIDLYADRLPNSFVVVTESTIRISEPPT